jgi:hypothetical protein
MTIPPTRLSANLVVRKDAVPEAAQPPRPQPVHRHAMTYRPRFDVHEQLATIAFNQRTKVQTLIDAAVEEWLERHHGWSHG